MSTGTNTPPEPAAVQESADREPPPPQGGPATGRHRAEGLRGAILQAVRGKLHLLVVLALVLIVGYAMSAVFLTKNNMLAVLTTSSVVSILAVGQFRVIVTGGIDLSVGSVLALSSVVAAMTLDSGQPFVVAVIAALAIAGAIGFINGSLVVFGGITPFIATLAMLSIARGLAYLLQTDRQISITSTSFLDVFSSDIAGIPTSVLIALLVMVVIGASMAFTRGGRRLYAIGGNAEAARLSGLPVPRDLIKAYMSSSMLAGLAGLILAAQLTQGSAIIGQGYELDSIAAVVVGGASLFGGTGDPVSAVLGGLVIAAISNLMDILGVQAEAQLIVKGLVILVAVLFTSGKGRNVVTRIVAKRAARRAAVGTAPAGQ
jgi:ribose transport system permease protein